MTGKASILCRKKQAREKQECGNCGEYAESRSRNVIIFNFYDIKALFLMSALILWKDRKEFHGCCNINATMLHAFYLAFLCFELLKYVSRPSHTFFCSHYRSNRYEPQDNCYWLSTESRTRKQNCSTTIHPWKNTFTFFNLFEQIFMSSSTLNFSLNLNIKFPFPSPRGSSRCLVKVQRIQQTPNHPGWFSWF